jgi:hypothetical protein
LPRHAGRSMDSPHRNALRCRIGIGGHGRLFEVLHADSLGPKWRFQMKGPWRRDGEGQRCGGIVGCSVPMPKGAGHALATGQVS